MAVADLGERFTDLDAFVGGLVVHQFMRPGH
jgi:hypothetical protein